MIHWEDFEVEKVGMTPALVTKWFAKWWLGHQRNMKPWITTRYVQEIVAERFAVAQIDRAYCAATGKHYLLNGYHRGEAVKKAERTEPLWQTLVTIPCDTYEDVLLAYRLQDQGAPRSSGDILVAMDMHNVLKISITHLRQALTALGIIGNGFRARAGAGHAWRTPDQQLTALWIWQDAIREYVDHLPKETNLIQKVMCQSPVMAVALVTFHEITEPDKRRHVTDFWYGMTDLSQPAGAAAPILTGYLMAQAQLPPYKRDKTHLICQKAAYAFKRHVENRQVKGGLVGYSDAQGIDIPGTKYKSGVVIPEKFEGEGPDFKLWSPKPPKGEEKDDAAKAVAA